MIWIWNKTEENNSYVEFKTEFNAENKNTLLRIGSDYKYVAYLNGKRVSNGQYADVPEYKCINEKDVTDFVKEGKNELHVICWHMGTDYAVSRTMKASVAFEVIQDGKVIALSNGNTLCRKMNEFTGYVRITAQLGEGYNYDFTAEKNDWENAVVVENGFVEVKRPIKELLIKDLIVPEISCQGVFKWNGGTDTGEMMQNAWLSTMDFGEMTGKNRLKYYKFHTPLTFKGNGGDGVFVIFDMKKETCGFIEFALEVNKKCDMYFGWGEHLSDLRPRTYRDGRNFTIKYTLAKGKNVFENYLLRLGGRYICVYVEADEVTFEKMGLAETVYPFNKPEKDFGDKLFNKIYEVGRRTLELCAHEHYEDCPWREQALYGMDSRNQMLFGYGAFGEYEYPRANLMLFAKSLQDDGLVQLCAPATASITIPSFTAYWIIAIGENAKADYKESFVKEILPYAERAIKLFLDRNKDGITLFAEPQYWNFHEWSDGLDGGEIFRKSAIEEEYDCCLTGLTIIALDNLIYLEKKVGNKEKAEYYTSQKDGLKLSLEKFYDEESGFYASYVKDGQKKGYHVFTQSIVLSTGCVDKSRIKHICEGIKSPEGKLVDITLAGLQLKYDALLSTDKENNLQYCLDEIENTFGGMLLSGATSYWETQNGEVEFHDAGSLCHGWSAVPCYVFDKYLK